MTKFEINIENSYGIKKMEETIDFCNSNIAAIYAPNGVMKTSFAKTIHGMAEKSENKPEDRVSPELETKVILKYRDNEYYYNNSTEVIEKSKIEDIHVILSHEETESDTLDKHISKLLVDTEGRKKYEMITNELKTGNLEFTQKLCESFNSKNTKANLKLILSNIGITRDIFDLKSVKPIEVSSIAKELLRSTISDSSEMEEKIQRISTSNLFVTENFIPQQIIDFIDKTPGVLKIIDGYLECVTEKVKQSTIFDENFMPNKAENVKQSLKENFFFTKHVVGMKSDKLQFQDEEAYFEYISNEIDSFFNDENLKNHFEKIENAFNKTKKTKEFYEHVKENRWLLEFFSDAQTYNRVLVIVALKQQNVKGVREDLETQLEKYDKEYAEILLMANEQKVKWEEVISVFNSRFHMPFSVEVNNTGEAILHENRLPEIEFVWNDATNAKFTRSQVEAILSRGELRALYLLDMIFKLEVIGEMGDRHLLIFDDIVDSFDYKNKYAIIEYLKDISEKTCSENSQKFFDMIILTHNYDFYRTVTSRLDIKDKNMYAAKKEQEQVKLGKAANSALLSSMREGFVTKRKNGKAINDIDFVGLIPFARNLIEYTKGNRVQQYLSLTQCLHVKETNPTKETIIHIFDDLFGIGDIIYEDDEKDRPVRDIIKKLPGNKNPVGEKKEFHLKTVLAIAIRLELEEFLIEEIQRKDLTFDEFDFNGNQTANLISKYKELYEEEEENNLKICGRVSVLTPETIHVNSFMIEPLIDISVEEFKELYNELEVIRTTKKKGK